MKFKLKFFLKENAFEIFKCKENGASDPNADLYDKASQCWNIEGNDEIVFDWEGDDHPIYLVFRRKDYVFHPDWRFFPVNIGEVNDGDIESGSFNSLPCLKLIKKEVCLKFTSNEKSSSQNSFWSFDVYWGDAPSSDKCIDPEIKIKRPH